VSNYFGRTYEPRFLTGIIAGSMTRTNLLGYAATSPTPEVVSCINAFALGAKLVNPYVKVKVAWTREWNSHERFTDADKILVDAGADIISNRNLTVPREVTSQFGVYSMLCIFDPETKKLQHHLAAPIWHWGAFYEKIVRNITNESYKALTDMFSSSSKLVNFWWGMASGVLDIYYVPKYIPVETQKLVELMKKMIINNDYHPFTGPIMDTKGIERIAADEVASQQQILKMNWFADNVETMDFPC
jgi:basic membrane lipoprotein Med (substrate-binding protein (PBP1-ABC) superfamily)